MNNFVVRRTFQGAWEISKMTDAGYLFTRQYMDYTLDEAVEMFDEDFAKENA
jgi:hypothetical protein